jgi:hypothetical protein
MHTGASVIFLYSQVPLGISLPISDDPPPSAPGSGESEVEPQSPKIQPQVLESQKPKIPKIYFWEKKTLLNYFESIYLYFEKGIYLGNVK